MKHGNTFIYSIFFSSSFSLYCIFGAPSFRQWHIHIGRNGVDTPSQFGWHWVGVFVFGKSQIAPSTNSFCLTLNKCIINGHNSLVCANNVRLVDCCVLDWGKYGCYMYMESGVRNTRQFFLLLRSGKFILFKDCARVSRSRISIFFFFLADHQ